MYQNQVAIGPEFFAKSFNDYCNWRWAIIREFMQNSIDAGSTRISIDIVEDNGFTTLTVENDGEPMTENILTTKLLSLGGSGKNFNGTTGGFGKAKEILYYAHNSYSIHTGSCLVQGSGAGYNLTTSGDFLSGTRSTVTLNGRQKSELTSAALKFVNTAQWDGTVVINGESHRPSFRKGSPRRELNFGTVYTNRGRSNSLVVRINGTTMFTTYIDYEHCVLLELNGTSQDVLASCRDVLKHPYNSQLDEFITELATNKRSALKHRAVTEYIHYNGEKLIAGPTKTKFDIRQVATLVSPKSNDAFADAGNAWSTSTEERPGLAPNVGEVQSRNAAIRSALKEDFVIKNNLPNEVPAYFRPDNVQWSSYSQKLAKIWSRLLVQLHRSFDVADFFSVGFIFDDEIEGQREVSDEYGVVYYINPAKLVNGQLSKRYKLTSRGELIMLAVHEFCHHKESRHDEDFASLLTEYGGKVLDKKGDFAWCFKG